MDSGEVENISEHTSPKVYLSVIGLLAVLFMVAAAVMAAAMPSVGRIWVFVGEQEQYLPLGTTVGDLLDSGMLSADPGDLLSVDGEVLVEGGGEPVVVERHGVALSPATRLHDGDHIEVTDGDDVTESIVTSLAPMPPPVEYEGSGPFEEVKSEGRPGVMELHVGEVSGSVVDSRVVEPPEPMVVLRRNARPGDKIIALTFDDGPWPLQTQQVVEILARENVKATFFMLGKQVRRHRDIAAMVAEEGHLIGNHSLSHVYLNSRVSTAVVRSEIENCQAEIERATGERPRWYRPPGGVVSPAVWAQTRASKLKLIKWNVDPKDYKCSSPTVLARRVIDSAKPGAIVVLHDGGGDRTCTVKALTTIIRELKARGYTFVTLDEMYPAQSE